MTLKSNSSDNDTQDDLLSSPPVVPTQNPQPTPAYGVPIAPLQAPENIDNPFVASMQHNITEYPLHKMIAKDFIKSAKSGLDFANTVLAAGDSISERFRSTLAQKFPELSQTLNKPIINMPVQGYLDKFFDSTPPKFMSSDEYKASPWFRQGIDYPNGVTENLAKLSADNQDEDALFQDERSRTSGSVFSVATQAASALAGTVASPINLALNAVTDGEYATAKMAELIPQLRNSATAIRGVRGGIETGLFGVTASSIDYGNQRLLGQHPNPMQIVYSGIINAGLGGIGGIFIPKLLSKYGSGILQNKIVRTVLDHPLAKKFNLDKVHGWMESYTPITPQAHDALMEAASGQLENNIVPDLTDYTQQALFEHQQDAYAQIQEAGGDMDDRLQMIETQKDAMQDAITKIDERLKGKIPEDSDLAKFGELDPKDETEISKLKSDRDILETQVEQHEAILMLKSKAREPVPMDQVQAKADSLRKPESDITFNTGDDEPFKETEEVEPHVEEEPHPDEIEAANEVKQQYDKVKDKLTDGERGAVDKAVKEVGDAHDARQGVWIGVKNCLEKGES